MSLLTVGNYELTTLLGAGGLGQVYGGVDTELGRAVAIKVLRPELASDQSLLQRFRDEAKNLAKLHHPNITTLFALQRQGEQLFMVMEMVEGRTLESVLQERRLPVEESLDIIGQVITGLAYAHERGIIHRDIKPANVMVMQSGLVKLMDFGIARVRGSKRLTRTGHIVGTLAYMSPEQVRGEEGDERSDLYSLAIMLYEMLSGVVPFDEKSDYELIRAHVETPPPPLAGLVPGLAPRTEAALMRALAKDPQERFATVAAFGAALGLPGMTAAGNAPRRHDEVSGTGTRDARDIGGPEESAAKSETAKDAPGPRVQTDAKPPSAMNKYLPVAALGGALVIAAAAAAIIFSGAPAPNPAKQPPASSAQVTPPAAIAPPPPPAQTQTVVNPPPDSSMLPNPTPHTVVQQLPELNGPVVQVLDSNAFIVNGSMVTLFGVVDPFHDGDAVARIAAQASSTLSGDGNNVDCVGHDLTTYECTIQSQNVALLMLENGLATTTGDVPADYRDAQQAAQNAHRGIWATQN